MMHVSVDFAQLLIQQLHSHAVYYANVTTLRLGICYRKSVCLSCVCNVRLGLPYSAGYNFRQCFYAILYCSHPQTNMQILRSSSQGSPPSGLKRKRGSQI